MVIKPYGYSDWKKCKAELDRMFKKQSCECLFPALYRKVYLSKEASHIQGFAKEFAVSLTTRLKKAKMEVES